MSGPEIQALRLRLEAIRDELAADTLDLLEAVAAMLVEDAVLAGLEDQADPGRPGLAPAHATRATELQQVAAAVASAAARLASRRG